MPEDDASRQVSRLCRISVIHSSDVYYDRDPETKGMMANQQNTALGLIQGSILGTLTLRL